MYWVIKQLSVIPMFWIMHIVNKNMPKFQISLLIKLISIVSKKSIYKKVNYNLTPVLNANIIQNKNNFWVRARNWMYYRGIIVQCLKSSSLKQIALVQKLALLFNIFCLLDFSFFNLDKINLFMPWFFIYKMWL